MLTIGLLFPAAFGDSHEAYHTYRNPVFGIPVSLAVGGVESPPFHVKKATYAIIIQFAKQVSVPDSARRLSVNNMACMIGDLDISEGGINHCHGGQLLQADWTVKDGKKRIVAQGGFHQRGMQCVYLKDFILKYIGYFKGERGGIYTLEIRFTKDGSPLNICDPQLIVMRTGGGDYLN